MTTDTQERALSGITVLELGSDVSAPYSAKLLADLGATVIKIEPPEGDPARRYGPFPGSVPDPEKSGLFLYLNANKQGVVLDLTTEAGRDAFRELVRTADILIENTAPGTLDGLGLSYATLSELNPRLVMTSVTPLGQDPELRGRKAYPFNIWHASGSGWRMGDPDREPLTIPGAQSSYSAGITAAGATLIALMGRDASGQGQYIDVSELEVLNCFFGINVTNNLYNDNPFPRKGHRVGGMNACLECKDGYIHLIVGQPDWWDRFVKLIGSPEWATSPEFANQAIRGQQGERFEELIRPWLMSHTKEELFALCQANRFPVGPYYTIADAAEHRHLHDRGYFVELDHPVAGRLSYLGAPYKLSETPWDLRTPAPLLGQHNDEVLGRLPKVEPAGVGSASISVRPAMAGAAPAATETERLPLEGLRVLDFGVVWAGPVLGMHLASMGAEVIKVESWAHLDTTRRGGGANTREDILAGGPGIHIYARNKKSITLNLTKPEAVDLFKRLVKVSDVITNNFTPHVLHNWGLDYPELRKVKPDIILASLSASGLSGPLMNITTYAPVLGALVGIEGLVGYWGERSIGSTLQMGDPLNGTFGVVPVLAALRHRNRTGQGQEIDMSQWESWATVLGEFYMDYAINRDNPGPQGNRHRWMAPHNVYPCAGDDNWVSIAVGSEEEWQALCGAIGAPEWTRDARFSTMAARWEHQVELDRLIGAWTRERERDAAAELLQQSGVAAWPSLRTQELTEYPPNVRRGTYIQVDHPTRAGEVQPGFHWRMHGTPARAMRRAPYLGEHNEDVLGGLLGVSKTEFDRLVEAQVIY